MTQRAHKSPPSRTPFNVLHLLGDPADIGGILTVLRSLQEATESLGDHHVVWVRRGYQETRHPSLTYRYSRFLLAESPRHAALLCRAVPSFLELQQLLRKEPFNVVHAHTRGAFPVAALLCGITRRHVAFTNHTYATRTLLYRWATRLPRFHTVVLTPNMARHYRLQAPSSRVSIISECCRELFFNIPPHQRPRRTPADNTVRLVGVGNIVRWKKWHVLLDALDVLKPQERSRIQFVHWGEAPADSDSRAYERELHEHVSRAGLAGNVRFQGPTNDVQLKLREADWFVLPSTNEPCSVALIEALALGLPALVSASGGNVDIVTPDTTGLLFAPDDASDLAGQLRNLLRADLCMAPPEAIRHSVEARRPAIVAQHYRDLYQRIQILHADPSSGFTKAAGPGGAPDTPGLGQRPPEP